MPERLTTVTVTRGNAQFGGHEYPPMSHAVDDALDRVRRPEYTGENRCLPCTAVNVVIAAVLAAAVGALWLPAGVAVLLASLAAIWLRGYLVPRTPALTKRYFPEWLLALFDTHEAAGTATDAADAETDPVDVERILLSSSVLRERADGDLEVTPAFGERWRAEIETAKAEGTERETLAALLGADADDLRFSEFGTAFVALQDGIQVGRWESEAAFLADVGAARALEHRLDDWESYTPAQRGQLLSGLRLFVEECPDCGGPVRFGQEVVTSCCRSVDVVAVTCDSCEARLFEMDAPDELAA